MKRGLIGFVLLAAAFAVDIQDEEEFALELEPKDEDLGIEVIDDEFDEDEMVELVGEWDIASGRRLYNGFQMIRVHPASKEDVEVLKFLEQGPVEFWTPLAFNGSFAHDVDLLVGPKHLEHVKSYLQCSNIQFQIAIDDLQRIINEENVEADGDDDQGILDGRPAFCPGKTGMNWRKYHTFETISKYLDCLAVEHSDKVRLFEIGRSHQGRPLRVIKIGRSKPGVTKPAIWIDGGIHAREWISPASVVYTIYQFVENYDENRHIVDNYDIFVLPVTNPDGYEYSHRHDRMWRKNRRPSTTNNFYGRACHGVDLNRNFGYKWGGPGASTNPCKETYRGATAFSEPESQAVRDFIMARTGRWKAYLTFHSYGQYWLYPWGHARLDVPDYNDLHNMATKAAGAMKKKSGNSYSIGSAAKLLYPAAGGSDDWAKGGAGIKYSFTIELPDRGRYGFILPTKFIKNVGVETYHGVKALAEELIRIRA